VIAVIVRRRKRCRRTLSAARQTGETVAATTTPSNGSETHARNPTERRPRDPPVEWKQPLNPPQLFRFN